MKKNIILTKSLVVAISLTFILSSCSSWHYQHSRVSVDHNKVISLPVEVSTPLQYEIIPMNNKVELNTKEHTKVTNVKSKNVDRVKNISKTYPVTTTPVTTKTSSTPKKSIMAVFTDNIKKIGKAFQAPKTIEKSALSGWVRIMVILFVVGFILLLIGIFLSVFIYGGFWWLFYTFGALCILAGLIVMILGLVGLI
jgi:hypothetical protein